MKNTFYLQFLEYNIVLLFFKIITFQTVNKETLFIYKHPVINNISYVPDFFLKFATFLSNFNGQT